MNRNSLHDRRLGYRRALRIGLAISVAAHLLLLLVLARSLRIVAPEARAPATDREIELQGPLALEIGRILPPSEVPDEDEDAMPPPEEALAEEERLEDEPQGPPVVAEGRLEGEDRYLTNAERLQPKEGDERLWPEHAEDEVPIYLADNPYARYEGEIRARLGVILDSLNLSEEQRRRATEWLTGEDGGEWGVSEEGIHLGGIVIPINLGALLGEEGPRGRESRQERRDLEDIQYQDMLQDAQEVQEERARQMRERTKEELEKRLRDSLGVASDSTEESDEQD